MWLIVHADASSWQGSFTLVHYTCRSKCHRLQLSERTLAQISSWGLSIASDLRKLMDDGCTWLMHGQLIISRLFVHVTLEGALMIYSSLASPTDILSLFPFFLHDPQNTHTHHTHKRCCRLHHSLVADIPKAQVDVMLDGLILSAMHVLVFVMTLAFHCYPYRFHCHCKIWPFYFKVNPNHIAWWSICYSYSFYIVTSAKLD